MPGPSGRPGPSRRPFELAPDGWPVALGDRAERSPRGGARARRSAAEADPEPGQFVMKLTKSPEPCGSGPSPWSG